MLITPARANCDGIQWTIPEIVIQMIVINVARWKRAERIASSGSKINEEQERAIVAGAGDNHDGSRVSRIPSSIYSFFLSSPSSDTLTAGTFFDRWINQAGRQNLLLKLKKKKKKKRKRKKIVILLIIS
ncbi:hypothetical protein PUN28_000569 [Cardiocondyla obscurior]|uniref:Uncharacterized protein n=1 Tax=Cardiocondyla obscurior TaxID=286306 RepID=A0AAW2H057_9HYME